MKKSILFHLLLSIGLGVYSQSGSYFDTYKVLLPNIINPAPTSQALQKYLGYPVSHSTGLIDIGIPLYQIPLKNGSIPILLKYHSSGIKIQDSPGIIGYGWSLFPGFKISRTIMGKPDEKYPITENIDLTETSANFDLLQKRLINIATPASEIDLATTEDGQYDIFSIHLPEIDASFILQYTDGVYKAVTIPDAPLVIKPNIGKNSFGKNESIQSFEVTDNNGNKYEFGGSSDFRETTKSRINNYNTGWMLKQITRSTGEVITLQYKTTYEYPAIVPSYTSVTDNGKCVGSNAANNEDIITHINSIVSPAGYTVSTSSSSYEEPSELKIPISIKTNNETITFNYSNTSSKREYISSIKVESATNEIKSVELNNDNAGFLTKINISGEGIYEFNYNTNPSQFSQTAIDWWGYYNGRSSTTNIPSLELNIATHSGGSSILKVGTASREPDASYISAKSLNKIIYPTGGYLTINYEPHKFNINGVEMIGGGLRVNSVESYDPVSNKKIKKQYQYEDAHYTGGSYPKATDYIRGLTLCRTIASVIEGRFSNIALTVRSRIINTFASNSGISNNSTPVWYGKVTELTEDGKRVFIYDYKPDDHNNRLSLSPNDEFHIQRLNHLSYGSPRLLNEKNYKRESNQFIMVQSINNIYYPENPTISKRGIIAIPLKRYVSPNWK